MKHFIDISWIDESPEGVTHAPLLDSLHERGQLRDRQTARAHRMSERAGKATHRIGIGDTMTFYINRKAVDSPPNDPAAKVQQFRGIARVSGDAFESDDVIWHVRDSDIFPYRRAVEFLADATADVRPLIEKLSFVTNTTYWAFPFRKGYVEITPHDVETLQAAMAALGG
jgi:hypothetical protein